MPARCRPSRTRRAPTSRREADHRLDRVDCIVVGAGVVGLATARALALAGRGVVVLEAGDGPGRHASSRNSGVIHAGIYYPAGSLKARLCVAGRGLLYAYCAERGIPHRRIGKLIVAREPAEVPVLQSYVARARANGVDDLAWLSAGQAMGLEPELRCVAALLSPSTGILDVHAYLLALQADLESAGGAVLPRARVTGIRADADGFTVEVDGAPGARCAALVNAAGAWAPELAGRIAGLPGAAVPRARFAAGHYYAYAGAAPFHRLVYPVAGDGGLGIHVTLDLAGRVRFGPDASWRDGVDYAFDDTRRAAFVAAIRRYYPGLDADRLQPDQVGVRPRIHGPGEPAADFLLQGPRQHGVAGLLNLFGIESPGLTASLALADAAVAALGAPAGAAP